MKTPSKANLIAVSLSTIVFVFISCATTSSQIPFHEEAFANDQNDVIIYVYRMSSFVGGAVILPVRLDGKLVANLKQNAYVVFHTTPGEHEIAVGNSTTLAYAINQAITKKSRTLAVTPKSVYFLRSQAGVTFIVTREEAMKEIVNTNYDMGL